MSDLVASGVVIRVAYFNLFNIDRRRPSAMSALLGPDRTVVILWHLLVDEKTRRKFEATGIIRGHWTVMA